MLVLLPLFLFPAALVANPVSINNVETSVGNDSIPSLPSSNTILGVPPPTGPHEFSCVVRSSSGESLVPKDVLSTAIRFLERIAQDEFGGRMTQAHAQFRGDNNIIFGYTSEISNQPIFRRYIIWAVVRVVMTMRQVTRFRGGIFDLGWEGRAVGWIRVGVAGTSNNQPVIDLTLDVPITQGSSTNITTTLGDDQIWWIYTPTTDGTIMTEWDVGMGTIGALVEAASLPSRNFNGFIGDLLPISRAVSHYSTEVRPSLLSRSILIRTIASAALWALNDGDFHDLYVKVFLDGKVIATGGYSAAGPGLVNLENGTALRSTE